MVLDSEGCGIPVIFSSLVDLVVSLDAVLRDWFSKWLQILSGTSYWAVAVCCDGATLCRKSSGCMYFIYRLTKSRMLCSRKIVWKVDSFILNSILAQSVMSGAMIITDRLDCWVLHWKSWKPIWQMHNIMKLLFLTISSSGWNSNNQQTPASSLVLQSHVVQLLDLFQWLPQEVLHFKITLLAIYF